MEKLPVNSKKQAAAAANRGDALQPKLSGDVVFCSGSQGINFYCFLAGSLPQVLLWPSGGFTLIPGLCPEGFGGG